MENLLVSFLSGFSLPITQHMHDGAGVGHFLLLLTYLLTINNFHFPHFHSILGAPDKGIGSYTYSSGTSIASSECGSDDLYNDDDETFLQNIHLSSCLLADLQTSDISGRKIFVVFGCGVASPVQVVTGPEFSLGF